MKTYQTPMLVWQNVDADDILTGSPGSTITAFGGVNNDGEQVGDQLPWWG